MAQKLKKIGDKLRGEMRMLSVLCMTTMLCLQPALATNGTTAGDTIWTRFSDIMADVYGKLVGISTIVAVTAASVALLVRMISRNERAVAEASSWLKRIVVTWLVLNTLGFIVAYSRTRPSAASPAATTLIWNCPAKKSAPISSSSTTKARHWNFSPPSFSAVCSSSWSATPTAAQTSAAKYPSTSFWRR